MKNLGFIFDVLYNEYRRLGGKKEVWERMTTQNAIDALDI